MAGTEQLGAQNRGETDRPGADDDHHVGRTHTPVEYSHLVRRGQDVGEHEHLLVTDPLGDLVGRVVRERNSHQFGLGSVDQMSENPAASVETLAVPRLAAVSASAAGGDARDQYAVTGHEIANAGADFDDSAHGFVTENSSVRHRRNVTTENVQIGAADRHRVDAHDRVGRFGDRGVGHVFPRALSRTMKYQCFHPRPPADRWRFTLQNDTGRDVSGAYPGFRTPRPHACRSRRIRSGATDMPLPSASRRSDPVRTRSVLIAARNCAGTRLPETVAVDRNSMASSPENYPSFC